MASVGVTNQRNGSAFNTITNTIKDSYLGYENRNWLEKYGTRNINHLKYNDSIKSVIYVKAEKAKSNTSVPQPEQIVGRYADDWFGHVIISHDAKRYSIKCVRSPRLFGELLPFNRTTFVTKWADRSYDADVFMQFTFNEKGDAVSVTMKYIAPITDFSFDFHDLELVKTN